MNKLPCPCHFPGAKPNGRGANALRIRASRIRSERDTVRQEPVEPDLPLILDHGSTHCHHECDRPHRSSDPAGTSLDTSCRVLPILISVSVTPGPYFFAARAGSAAAASALGAAARIVRRVRRVIGNSLFCCRPSIVLISGLLSLTSRRAGGMNAA